jgi:lysophospholipase L1-like esterase
MGTLRVKGLVLLNLSATLVILLGVLGISSILLTIAMYAATFGLLAGCVVLIVKSSALKNNALLLLAVSMLSLFGGELFLKYVYRKHLTYAERNGAFFYVSEYKQHRLQNWGKRWLFKRSDVQITHHHPNTTETPGSSEFSYSHSYNSLGLRGSEPAIKGSGHLLILALGDSFTEGIGTPADSTWPVLLQQFLHNEYTDKDVVCINGGVNSSDPFTELLLLKRVLKRYEPDLILLAVNSTDITDYIWRGGMERFQDGKLKYRKGPLWEFVYQFSYLFRAIIHEWAGHNWMLLNEKQMQLLTAQAYEALTDLIREEFMPIAAETGAQVAVFIHPMRSEIEAGNPALQGWLAEFSQQEPDLTNIDLMKEMQEYFLHNNSNAQDYYWPIDLHHNSKGYELLAKLLKEQLTQFEK